LKKEKLKIGRIPYANLFPTFYCLEKECDLSGYKFIRGVPSALNKMLREGRIDISPSSSIEYLKNKRKYFILPWFSISSKGPINSILLFSKYPLKELNGKNISVSSDSETSSVLLKVILREFLSIKCRYKKTKFRSVKNALTSSSAALLIGDEAMKEAKRQSAVSSQRSARKKTKASRLPAGQAGITPAYRTGRPQPSLYIYDLGDLWFKYTGLPFVFALWIVRKDVLPQKMELVRKLASGLLKAKKNAPEKFSSIAKQAPQKKWMAEKDLVKYWKCISYDFTEKHMEGLKLFEEYALKNKTKIKM